MVQTNLWVWLQYQVLRAILNLPKTSSCHGNLPTATSEKGWDMWGSNVVMRHFHQSLLSNKLNGNDTYRDVSKNKGTPKWMVYIGKPYQNGWFGGTIIFGNTHIYFLCTYFTALPTKNLHDFKPANQPSCKKKGDGQVPVVKLILSWRCQGLVFFVFGSTNSFPLYRWCCFFFDWYLLSISDWSQQVVIKL